MRIECAWCQKVLSEDKPQLDSDNIPISHGICPDCIKQVLSFKTEPMRDYLDRFAGPVLLVDSENRVITANKEGFSMLKKEPQDVEGELRGDALECKYASLPEGCGNSIHCKTCTIRRTLMDTIESGVSHHKVAAYPDLSWITGETRIKYLITTEKLGEAVLLRIDEVSEENYIQ